MEVRKEVVQSDANAIKARVHVLWLYFCQFSVFQSKRYPYHENESIKSHKSEKEDNELSDLGVDCNGQTVIIDIEEKALKCDKRLLTQHSKYFEALFSFQEIPTNRVRLKGILLGNEVFIVFV